jgi:hypothetical protein
MSVGGSAEPRDQPEPLADHQCLVADRPIAPEPLVRERRPLPAPDPATGSNPPAARRGTRANRSPTSVHEWRTVPSRLPPVDQ